MTLQRVQTSVVRSIRHVSLIRNWARARRHGALPHFVDFVPDERSGDSDDLLISERRLDGDETRFFCRQAGARVQQIFDRPMHGGYVRDIVDPNYYKVSFPIWTVCITEHMPVYSITRILDRTENPVTIEQLHLPYELGNGVVDTVVSSIHVWSTEVRFTIKGLLADIRAPFMPEAMIVDPSLPVPGPTTGDINSI